MIKDKHIILLFCINLMIQTSVFAQNVNVKWTNFYNKKENKGYPKPICTESKNKIFIVFNESNNEEKPNYKIGKFDENLNLEKMIYVPSFFNNEKIDILKLVSFEDNLMIVADYYESKGENRYCLIKSVVSQNLDEKISFTKVKDIAIKSALNQRYFLNLDFSINQNSIFLTTIPKVGIDAENIYQLEIYDNKFSKKEWSAQVDLSDFLKEYKMVNYSFTKNKEFVFLLEHDIKFLKKVKNKYILGKYTEEKGIEIIKFEFSENEFSTNVRLIIDNLRNEAYIYNIFWGMKLKKNAISIKKIKISDLSEVYSRIIDFGTTDNSCFKGSLGFLSTSYSFENFTPRKIFFDSSTCELKIIAELQVPFRMYVVKDQQFKDKGINGNIVVLKIDSNGNKHNYSVIPHGVKSNTYSDNYVSFLHFLYKNDDCFLMYDHEANSQNALCNEKTKTKILKSSDDNELYAVLLRNNNEAQKIKPEKSYVVEGNKFKKFLNFELNNIIPLSDNKFLVFNGNLFGVLSIK